MGATPLVAAPHAATDGPLVTAVPVTAAMQGGTLDVELLHSAALAVFEPLKVDLKPKHAIEFFSDIKRMNPANQQQLVATCTICFLVVRSTGSTKLVEHLTKCGLCACCC